MLGKFINFAFLAFIFLLLLFDVVLTRVLRTLCFFVGKNTLKKPLLTRTYFKISSISSGIIMFVLKRAWIVRITSSKRGSLNSIKIGKYDLTFYKLWKFWRMKKYTNKILFLWVFLSSTYLPTILFLIFINVYIVTQHFGLIQPK